MSGHSQEIPLSGRRRVSHRFWETARLALLLGDGTSRVAFGRRHVSRGTFWEATRLASLLGDGASRVDFGRRRVSRRFSRNSSHSEGWRAKRNGVVWDTRRFGPPRP